MYLSDFLNLISVGGITGSMESGKSNLVANIHKNTNKYFNNTFVISPTFESDENENYFRQMKNIKTVAIDTDEETLTALIEEIGKYSGDRNLLIIDDTGVIKKASLLSRLVKLHRHANLSIIFVIHYLKDVPLDIRSIVKNWCVFRLNNNKEIQYFYDEFGGNYSKDEFKGLLDICTLKPHSFMYLNGKGKFIMECFNKIVG